MAINAGTVFINVAANTGPFRQQMLGLGSQISKVGSTVSRVGTGLSRALTLPLGLAGAASVKLALDYESAFTKISAVTNASRDDIAKWREDVLTLSGKTARAPEELANALYTLASAGLKPSQVFPALRESAKAAAVGMGDVNSVARLVTAALNAYGPKALDAAKATDILVSAVKEGRAEPEEFGDAIGRILPIAKNAKVSFAEVAGSLAAVSNIGLDVNEGITAMRGLMKALIVPGTQAAETLKKIGISTVELRDLLAEKGLLGTMQILERRTKSTFGKQWLDAMNKIIPNIRALTGGLGLTTQEASRVQAIFDKVAHSQGEAGKAFDKTTKGPMFQFQQGLNQLRIAGIKLGQDLLPIVLDIVHTIADWAEAFTNLSEGAQSAIIKIGLFLALLGPALRIIGSGITVVAGLASAFKKLASIGSSAATATAGVGEQLTLFSTAGGASAITSGAAAITGGIALLVGGLIGLKLAIDDVHEAADKMVEGFRTGHQPIERVTDVIDANTDAIKRGTTAFGGYFYAAHSGLGQAANVATEALSKIEGGLYKVARNVGLNAVEVDQWAHILINAQHPGKELNAHVLQLVGSFKAFGLKLKQSTINLVEDYLSIGKNAKAVNVLERAWRQASKPITDNAKGIQDSAKASRDADHAQRLLAGGVEHAQGAMRRAANAVKEVGDKSKGASDNVKHLKDQINGLPKNKTTNINANGSQAQRVMQGIRDQLEAMTNKEWVIPISAKQIAHSPIPSVLFDNLLAQLEDLTGKEWNVKIGAFGAEDEGIKFMATTLKESQRELQKLGEVADKVFGEEFPKAYADDVAALKKATQEKSKELEKQLNSAQKTFDKLKDKLNSFKDQIRSGFADTASLVQGALEGLSRTIDQTVTDSEGNESTIQIEAPIDISSFLQEQIAQAQDFAKKLAKLAAGGLAPAILGELASQGQSALPLIDALLSGGKGLIGEFNAAQKEINKFASVTADALGEEKFGGALKKARNNIEHLSQRIDNFANRLDAQADQLAQGLRRLGNATEDTVNAIYRAISGIGGEGPRSGRTRMAAGGVVTRATNITAGEAGPEAIIPLDKAKLTTSAPVNVYITVEGNVIRESDLAAAVRDKLLRDKRFKGTLGLG